MIFVFTILFVNKLQKFPLCAQSFCKVYLAPRNIYVTIVFSFDQFSPAQRDVEEMVQSMVKC